MNKDKLVKALSSNFDLAAAVLFGSCASGHDNSESDIDIALLYSQSKTPDPLDLLQFREELSEIMKQEVDLVLLNDASPIIAMQAIKNGIPLFIREKKAYDAFEIKLITDYADLKRLREPFEKSILNRNLHD